MTFESLPAVMRHALALAARGAGRVEPNPQVGAIVVDDRLRLLGCGWHERFGGPHAEVHALREAGDRSRGAMLVVTLEPCAHFGKTPPCADAVVAAGIRKVVVGTVDPAPHADGRGIARLREAGIEVEVGVLESAARRLIEPFATLTTAGRPFVHAKWAMTLDGRIAARTGQSQWISGKRSRAIAHELRGRMDAILIGVGTLLTDDPLLTARPPGPRTATRIVVDSRGRVPATSRLMQSAADVPTLLAVTEAAPNDWRSAMQSLGAEVLPLPADAAGRVDLRALLAELGRRRMTNLLAEGGSGLLGSLFDADLIDACDVFIAPKIVGGAAAPGPIGGRGRERIPEPLFETQITTVDGDVHLRGWLRSCEASGAPSGAAAGPG